MVVSAIAIERVWDDFPSLCVITWRNVQSTQRQEDQPKAQKNLPAWLLSNFQFIFSGALAVCCIRACRCHACSWLLEKCWNFCHSLWWLQRMRAQFFNKSIPHDLPLCEHGLMQLIWDAIRMSFVGLQELVIVVQWWCWSDQLRFQNPNYYGLWRGGVCRGHLVHKPIDIRMRIIICPANDPHSGFSSFAGPISFKDCVTIHWCVSCSWPWLRCNLNKMCQTTRRFLRHGSHRLQVKTYPELFWPIAATR